MSKFLFTGNLELFTVLKGSIKIKKERDENKLKCEGELSAQSK